MSNIDTNTAWAKIKDFLANFRHDCEAELLHIEEKLGFVKPEVVAPVAPVVAPVDVKVPEPTIEAEAPVTPEPPAAS